MTGNKGTQKQPSGHTALAPGGVYEWTKNVRCVVEGCDRPLVWVRSMGRQKSSRWQHERGS